MSRRHDNLDLDSNWTNSSGEIGGNPAQMRRNEGVQSLCGDPDWAAEVRVAIQISDVGDDGLPDGASEFEALDAVEDLYRDALQRGGTCVLALVVTMDGIRDLIFYTSNPDAVIREFEERLKPATETHQVELTIRPDETWELYQRFA